MNTGDTATFTHAQLRGIVESLRVRRSDALWEATGATSTIAHYRGQASAYDDAANLVQALLNQAAAR